MREFCVLRHEFCVPRRVRLMVEGNIKKGCWKFNDLERIVYERMKGAGKELHEFRVLRLEFIPVKMGTGMTK